MHHARPRGRGSRAPRAARGLNAAALTTAAALAAATHPARATTYAWDPDPILQNLLGADWGDADNWTPAGVPGAADDVTGGGVFLRAEADHSARNVTLSGDGLRTFGARITIGDALRLNNTPGALNNTRAAVEPGPHAFELEADRVFLNGGASLHILGGVARVNRFIDVDGQSRIEGYGAVEFTSTATGRSNLVLTLDGEIAPFTDAGGGTLILRRASDQGTGVLSLSGSGTNLGRINVTSGSSRLSVLMPLSEFNGSMQVGRNNTAVFTEGFTLGPKGQLLLSANDGEPTAVSTMTVLGPVNIAGSVRARIGESILNGLFTFAPTAAVTIDNGGSIRLLDTTYQGGTFTGQGALIQSGDATFNGDTTISVDRYDWDGQYDNSNTTVNAGAHLVIGSIGLDDKSPAAHDGTITIKGGKITVNTPQGWTLNGTLNMQGPGVPTVAGKRLALRGTISTSVSGLMEEEGIFYFSGATLDTAGPAAMLTIKAPVTSDAGATVTKTGTGTLDVQATQAYAAGTHLHVNGGTVRMATNPAGGAAGAGNLTVTVANGAHLQLDAADNALASLTLNAGGRVTLSPGGGKTLLTRSLALSAITSNVSEVDLYDNGLIVDYSGASLLGQYEGFLKKGYHDGAWDGGVIDSSSAAADPSLSTALGIADASDVLGLSGAATGTFMGRTVDATSILIRYTRYGDANLDGAVDFADLVRLAQNYNTAGKLWPQGDFNYDGQVAFEDLVKLAQNYNSSLPTYPIPGAPAGFEQDLARAFAQAPEPAAWATLACAAGLLANRRVRRRDVRHRPSA